MKKHILHYLILIIILVSGFGLATYFKGDNAYQLEIISLTVLFYVLWGVMHQALHHTFSFKIMLEYFAIGFLGISIIYFVISIGL